MAEITAAMVGKLREMTGAGMMDCKKALTEANGDMEAAVDILRKKGVATAAKKAGREAKEGVIAQYIAPGGTARRAGGSQLRNGFRARKNERSAPSARRRQSAGCGSERRISKPMRVDQVAKIGENIQISRASARWKSPATE